MSIGTISVESDLPIISTGEGVYSVQLNNSLSLCTHTHTHTHEKFPHVCFSAQEDTLENAHSSTCGQQKALNQSSWTGR